MTKTSKSQQVAVRLPTSTYERLNALAKKRDCPMARIIVKAVERELNEPDKPI